MFIYQETVAEVYERHLDKADTKKEIERIPGRHKVGWRHRGCTTYKLFPNNRNVLTG